MQERNNYFVLLILIGIVMLFISPVYAVEDKVVSFQKALNWGLKHNQEIVEMNNDILEMTRNSKKIKAKNDWHLSYNSNFSYVKGRSYGELRRRIYPENYNLNNEQGLQSKLSLNLSKNYFSGLSINTQLNLNDTEPFDVSNLEDKYNYYLEINYPLFPQIVTESKRNLIKIDKNLEQLNREKDTLIQKKTISWLETYLTLLRYKGKIKIAEDELKLAGIYLDRAQERSKISEIGETELTSAKLNYRQREISLKEIIENKNHVEEMWYRELDLPQKWVVEIDQKSDIIFDFKDLSEKYNKIDIDDKKVILEYIKESNDELNAMMLQIENLEDELDRLNKEDKMQINSKISYSDKLGFDEEDWQIGIDVSWSILDGGNHDLSIKEKETELNLITRRYENYLDKLFLQWKQIKKDYNILQMKYELSKMEVENKENEINLDKIKWEKGIITKDEYLNKKFECDKNKIKLQEIEDQMLLKKLEILNYLGKI